MPVVNVKLYHPQPYQRAVLDGLAAHWEDAVHVVKAVRQCGKSMMLENLLIRVSLAHGNQCSVLIAPTYKQGKKIYKSILKKFRRTVLYGFSHFPGKDKEWYWQRTLEHMHEKYAEGGYLRLWIPESPNAARLEALRKIISDEVLLRKYFEKYYLCETNLP